MMLLRYEAPRVRKPSIWFEVARRAALAFPGVEERTSADGPVFTVGRKILARLDEDGISLLVYIDADEREMLMAADPRTFSAAKGQGGRAVMRVHCTLVFGLGRLKALVTRAHSGSLSLKSSERSQSSRFGENEWRRICSRSSEKLGGAAA